MTPLLTIASDFTSDNETAAEYRRIHSRPKYRSVVGMIRRFAIGQVRAFVSDVRQSWTLLTAPRTPLRWRLAVLACLLLTIAAFFATPVLPFDEIIVAAIMRVVLRRIARANRCV